MTTLASIIQKGGLGKTTTAVNVAVKCALEGKPTLLVDLDPQGTASLLLGVEDDDYTVYDAFTGECAFVDCIKPTNTANLFLAPSHLLLSQIETALPKAPGRDATLQKMLLDFEEHFEVTVIDTPPSLGILPIMALVAANTALIPLAPEELALQGLSQVFTTIDYVKARSNPKLRTRILLTLMVKRSVDSRDLEESTRTKYGPGVFQTIIPSSKIASRAISNRDKCGAVVAYAAKSPAALAYSDLIEEMKKETLLSG